jgi:hypothetical protein
MDDVPLQDRPKLLDRASLHYCLGGPFHPGCEMTWPMRHASLYYAPFRLRVRTTDNPERVRDLEVPGLWFLFFVAFVLAPRYAK